MSIILVCSHSPQGSGWTSLETLVRNTNSGRRRVVVVIGGEGGAGEELNLVRAARDDVTFVGMRLSALSPLLG